MLSHANAAQTGEKSSLDIETDRLASGEEVPSRLLLRSIVEDDFGPWSREIEDDPVFDNSAQHDLTGVLRPMGRSAIAKAALVMRDEIGGSSPWPMVRVRLLKVIEAFGYPGLVDYRERGGKAAI